MTPKFELVRSRQLLASGQPLKIVCYGDSICEVGRSPEWHGGATTPEGNWGQVLGRLLTARFPGSPVTALNFGIGGQNSYEGLGRLDGLRGVDADLVLVAFGANDCVYHHLHPEETQLALTTLARDARACCGCDVVLLGTAGDNPIAPRFQHLDATIAATRQAARDAGVNFIDMRRPVLVATGNGQKWVEFFQNENDCHPIDSGHALWAQIAFEALVPLLEPDQSE